MFRGPTSAIAIVFKCASRAPKDTELARAKRQVAAHGRSSGEDANEGTGLLGDHDGSDELVCVTVSVLLARSHSPVLPLNHSTYTFYTPQLTNIHGSILAMLLRLVSVGTQTIELLHQK